MSDILTAKLIIRQDWAVAVMAEREKAVCQPWRQGKQAGMKTAIRHSANSIPHQRWVRIIPIAVIMYILSFVDRVNVAMVLPYVDKGMGLASEDIGFAAGIYFLGYVLLQIPGGILASRWSARKVIAIFMVLWSLPAIASGLVQSRMELYVARFMLGLFAGGVWPAVLVLLVTWFPEKERARANALWMTCLPLSAIIMTPLTGAMLAVMSWRWVFILQGLPPLVWVIVWWLQIADRPSEAKWISSEEKAFLEASAAADARSKPPSAGYWAACTNPVVLLLIVAYFFWMAGFYGLTMWVPSVVKDFTGTGDSWQVGWISAIPFVFALISMVVNSAWSDRRMKRQLHVSIPLALGAFGLFAGQWVGHTPMLQMLFMIIAAIGIFGPWGPFWAVPSELLHTSVSGAAMGLINAIGCLGGFLGSFVVGWARGGSHGGLGGFGILGVFLLISAAIFLFLGVDRKQKPAVIPHFPSTKTSATPT